MRPRPLLNGSRPAAPAALLARTAAAVRQGFAGQVPRRVTWLKLHDAVNLACDPAAMDRLLATALRVLRQRPPGDELVFYLVRAARCTQDSAQRIVLLEEALGIKPHWSIAAELAWLLERAGQGERARGVAEPFPALRGFMINLTTVHHPDPTTHVWHGAFGSIDLRRMRVVPLLLHVAETPEESDLRRYDEVLAGVEAFYRHQFGIGLTIAAVQAVRSPATFGDCYHSIEFEARLWRWWGQRPEPHDVVMVACTHGTVIAQARGYARVPTRIAVFLLRNYAATRIAVHELGHAALNLAHCDGKEDALAPSSVMGKNDMTTFFNLPQRKSCWSPVLAFEVVKGALADGREGKMAEAETALAIAVRMAPDYRLIYQELARIRQVRGNLDGAIKVLEDAHKRFGGTLWSDRVAVARAAAGGLKHASPEIPGTFTAAGRPDLYLRHWSPKEQSSDLVRAGALHEEIHQFGKAEQFYRQALKLDRESGVLYIHLASVSWKRGKVKAARRFLALADAYPDTPNRWRPLRASLEAWRGRFRAAVHCLKPLTGAMPWYWLGYYQWSCGQRRASRQSFERALRHHGLLSARGQSAQAWAWWLADPADPRVPGMIRLAIGRASWDPVAIQLYLMFHRNRRLEARLRTSFPHHR